MVESGFKQEGNFIIGVESVDIWGDDVEKGQDKDASENQWEIVIVEGHRRWEWREERRKMFSTNLTW